MVVINLYEWDLVNKTQCTEHQQTQFAGWWSDTSTASGGGRIGEGDKSE